MPGSSDIMAEVDSMRSGLLPPGSTADDNALTDCPPFFDKDVPINPSRELISDRFQVGKSVAFKERLSEISVAFEGTPERERSKTFDLGAAERSNAYEPADVGRERSITFDTKHTERSDRSFEKRTTGKSDATSICSSAHKQRHRSIFFWRDQGDDDDTGSPPNSPGLPHKKKGKGAIVEVDFSEGTRISNFENFDEISDAASMVEPHRNNNYTFQYVARRSLLVGLVTQADVSVEDAARDIAEYTGASEDIAMTMYLAVVIGIGALELPAAFKDCGLIMGVLAICAFAVVNLFLAHRLIDVPQLARTTFAGYGDISLTLFDRFTHRTIGFMIVVAWFFCCLIFYFTLLYYIDIRNLDLKSIAFKEVLGLIVETVVVLLILPLTLYTDAKRLRLTAKLALNAMYGTGFLVVLGGLTHGIEDLTREDYNATHNFISPKEGALGVAKGVKSVATCFAGLGILPYVVSEMIQPHRAKPMMKKATIRMTIFYIVVGLSGYFGWGDNVSSTMVATYAKTDRARFSFYWFLAQLTSVLMAIKSFATFPLFVWPMYREVDAYLKLDSSPQVLLGLPWAINRLKYIKLGHRAALCALLYIFRRVCPHFRTIFAFGLVPIYLTQMVIIPFFSIASIWKNLSFIATRGIRGSAVLDSVPMFGDRREHLYKVCLVGGISIFLGVFLAWENLSYGLEQVWLRIREGLTKSPPSQSHG